MVSIVKDLTISSCMHDEEMRKIAWNPRANDAFFVIIGYEIRRLSRSARLLCFPPSPARAPPLPILWHHFFKACYKGFETWERAGGEPRVGTKKPSSSSASSHRSFVRPPVRAPAALCCSPSLSPPSPLRCGCRLGCYGGCGSSNNGGGGGGGQQP